MEFYVLSINELVERITPVLQKHSVRKAVLFGSYAKGVATRCSDVDMMVETSLRGLSFMQLYCDLQDALDGRELDLFADYEIIPKGRLDREIKSTGDVIYQC